MAVSDAHRRGNAKWDKENMRVVSCKIRSEEHAAFKAYAEARGKTISSLLLEYVRSCIAEDMEQKKNIEQNTGEKRRERTGSAEQKRSRKEPSREQEELFGSVIREMFP